MNEQNTPRPMNIYAKHGDKVIFTSYHGTDYHQKKAKEILKVGEVYEVDFTNVYNAHTDVKLIGLDGLFNSVLFSPVEAEREKAKE